MFEKLPPDAIRRVGLYDLLEKVGQGGMSSVYKAREMHTHRIVAVKVATQAVAHDPSASRRFELEYTLSQRLDHPNLARVIDCGIDDDNIPYMVMEYVDGPSLAQFLKSESCLDDITALAIFLQVADALTYLHGQKIIHRDIKPANILMTTEGDVKLVDLGLSKNLNATTELTVTGTGMGTMQFAAPEQFEDARHVDARSDVYSLAATMYLALTGEPPFGTGSHINVLDRKLRNQFDAPISKVPRLSRAYDAAIRLALHADRNRRPASCEEFVAILTDKKVIPSTVELPGNMPKPPAGATPAPEPTGRDRRASVRYSTDVESNCRPIAGPKHQRWAGTIKDISTTGMCVLVKRRFEINNVLEVAFPMGTSGDVTSHFARIRWIKQADGYNWLLGCEFVHPLSDDELESFLHERLDQTEMA